MNGDKIKLNTEIKMLNTPPMSPNNYRKLYVYLEWKV